MMQLCIANVENGRDDGEDEHEDEEGDDTSWLFNQPPPNVPPPEIRPY